MLAPARVAAVLSDLEKRLREATSGQSPAPSPQYLSRSRAVDALQLVQSVQRREAQVEDGWTRGSEAKKLEARVRAKLAASRRARRTAEVN